MAVKRIGRPKKPGTFKRVKVVSGVVSRIVGGGGGIFTPEGLPLSDQRRVTFDPTKALASKSTRDERRVTFDPTKALVSKRRIQLQRQVQIKKIQQQKIKLLRKAKTFAERKSISIAQVNRIKNLITAKTKEIIKAEFKKSIERKKRIEEEVVKGFEKIPLKQRKKLIKAFDIASAGSVTESRLNKRDAKLNEDIKDFNKNFGGKELSEKEFNKAKKQEKLLDEKRKQINKERDLLADSLKSKIGRFLGTTDIRSRLTKAEKRTQRKQIPKLEKEINQAKKIKKQIERKSKKTLLDRFKLKQAKVTLSSNPREIARIKRGEGPTVLMGDLPIVPATGIPRGVTSVQFLGKQKIGKAGKVTTDIIFRTSRGNVGIAKGVSVQKGSQGTSVVLGRFAKRGFRFPSRIVKLGKPRSFIGVEKVVSKGKVFKAKKTIDVIRKGKKIGKIDIIKGNIQGLLQRGVGKTAVVRGKKFFQTSIRFPSGKIKVKPLKKISFDDFASLSGVFTRRQLSVIIGKSISGRGAKSKFIGLIKGTSKAGKTFTVSGKQKQQFSKALQKVITASANAVAQAEQKTKGVSKVRTITGASRIISMSTGVIKAPIVKPLKTQVVKQTTIKPITKQTIKQTKQKVSIKRTAKAKTITKQLTRLNTKQSQLTKQKQKVRQVQRQLQTTLTKQRQRSLQKQLQKQTQKQRLIQRQVQVQVRRINTGLRTIDVPRIPRLIIPTIKRGKVKRKKKQPIKAQQVFNVFGKVKGKFVKLNTKPLTRNDALDKGAFAVDRTTAKTFKITSAGKAKKPGKLFKGEKNYFKRQGFKLREFKIRKGRKFKLKNKYIEKRKFGIDTRGEKKGLSIRRLLTQQRKRAKKKVVKRKSLKRRPIKRKSIKRRRTTITPSKARKILKDKKIRGKKLTKKQVRFFKAKASGKKRTLSKKQLDVLTAGRNKLKQMRKGR